MKHLTLTALCGLFLAFFAVSCAPKTAATGTTSFSKRALNGSWILTDIQFDGIPKGSKVSIFDEAPYQCFIGSQWDFVSNNNKGSFTLTATDNGCSTGNQPIIWSIVQENGDNVFQFKKLFNGDKAKNVTTGYKVSLSDVQATSMTWRAAVGFQGQTGYLVYSFQRK
ncbi:Lipocalin-like domain-containing protein [Chitinophaga costaii]|uniref:Lipocalin-like domain-containing protein n=1 Tax=Chitinophaga costaii TaxID=1335309 RepID=A0A1C4A7R0_9BACT|nr:lipocalin family protein [Chitinophaga costaii]PUZ26491.1 hypothetical protein DCM91_08715 [Chitinophaga costaii]SCB90552.1 Lipocalin-like domain-containing protein [Chitinophaga costaii]